MAQQSIPGYTYGTPAVPKAPISLEEVELIKKSLLFTDEDVQALRLSYEVLQDQVEEILDVWYGFVGSNPHLLHYFTDRDTHEPISAYLELVRKRFG